MSFMVPFALCAQGRARDCPDLLSAKAGQSHENTPRPLAPPHKGYDMHTSSTAHAQSRKRVASGVIQSLELGDWLISPLAGEMPGKAEGGAVPPAFPSCVRQVLQMGGPMVDAGIPLVRARRPLPFILDFPSRTAPVLSAVKAGPKAHRRRRRVSGLDGAEHGATMALSGMKRVQAACRSTSFLRSRRCSMLR